MNPQLPAPEELAVWREYEVMVMHFHSLLVIYRTTVLLGIAAAALTLAWLVKRERPGLVELRLRALWASALAVLTAVACLVDLGYYHPLLRGAVAELLRVERAHPQGFASRTVEELAPWSTGLVGGTSHPLHLEIQKRVVRVLLNPPLLFRRG